MKKIFITGIGTGVGKTLISAIVTQALEADYWKPIQAGLEAETDSQHVQKLINNTSSVIHPELFRLSLPASPHIAAEKESLILSSKKILSGLPISFNKHLIIEGAGGIMVPISKTEFIADLIKTLNAKVILVSRNYLGSINHSLLTAYFCKQHNIDVMGWIFNDSFMNYEDEIVTWSGYPKLLSIPFIQNPNKEIIAEYANELKKVLMP